MSLDAPTLEASPTPAARLQLSERQHAMLRAMGVHLWWTLPEAAASASAEVPAVRVPAAGRPRMPTPVQPPVVSATPTPGPGLRTALPAPLAPANSVVRPTVPVHGPADTDLDHSIRQCQRCALGAQQPRGVPGMGDRQADWLVLGEAPSEEDDRAGEPFTGRAGALLDRMLAAMGLRRDQQVYLSHVLKCRPPHHHRPSAEELTQCGTHLVQQVAQLQPRVLLVMGQMAAHSVLGQGGMDPAALQALPLGKLRGQVHRVTLAGLELPVVVTYTPAYLLRHPADKARAWSDLCLALRTLQQAPARAR